MIISRNECYKFNNRSKYKFKIDLIDEKYRYYVMNKC